MKVIRERAEASGWRNGRSREPTLPRGPLARIGDALFADFVHPSIRGHQLIAAAIAETLRGAGIPAAADRWRVGVYTDPDPGPLLAANPKLRVREHLVRALACDLALRVPCALAEVDAVLAIEPTHEQALQLRYHLTAPASG